MNVRNINIFYIVLAIVVIGGAIYSMHSREVFKKAEINRLLGSGDPVVTGAAR